MPALLLILALASSACVQENLAAFDVASIRRAPPPEPGRMTRVGPRGGPGSTDPARMTFDNMTLALLVMQAYDIKSYLLVAPSWANADRFVIIAKVPASATKEQARLMLRSLLIERFHLTVHHESKEMQVYDLIVGKSGHKLKESSVSAPTVDPTSPEGLAALQQKAKLDAEGYPVLPSGQSGILIESGHARWQ